MPKRTYNQITTTTKKFVPRKKRKVMRKRRVVKRVPRGPFPISRIAKLKLSTGNMSISSASGAIASIDVYANWPYFGTRHAFGWDQWALLYNEAVVLGSKITIYPNNDATETSSTAMLGGIYLADDTTNYTDYQDLIEANRGKFIRMSNNASALQRKCSNVFSAKKFFNVKDVKDNLIRLGSATSATSPGDAAIYKCWMQPLDKTTSVGLQMTAVVEYIVLFSEPKDVAAS